MIIALNTRWKARDELYKIHIPLHRSDPCMLQFSCSNLVKLYRNAATTSRKRKNGDNHLQNVCKMFAKCCEIFLKCPIPKRYIIIQDIISFA